MPLNKFITLINKPFETLVRGIKVYGLAESVTRTVGTESQTIPGVVQDNGEIKYVGPDDLQSVIIYHKVNALATRESTVIKGVGDQPNATINGYAMSMIVYLDRKKTKLTPDELFLYIQANFPFQLVVDPYVQVFSRINNAVLNGQTVFDSEFKGAKPLPATQSLMQINYTIESTFKQKCFEKCPED